jgi:hypothetical protein
MTRQGFRCRANIFPVVSLTKIKMLAKIRPDLTFECPTVDGGPSGDIEPRIPMVLLNAYELWFLAGE